MTDKQIIIDGVDVSGCVQFIQEEKDCCDLGGNCKGWTNCYYKQLKRKEQECEELKNKNYELTEEVGIDRALFAEIDKLNSELEQEKALKETYLACYKAKHEDIEGKLFKLKVENCELKGKVNLYEEILERSAQGFETGFQASTFANIVNGVANSIRDKKLFKLKQTLTEIKEIVEQASEDYRMPEEEWNKILQKISECEVENE